MVDNPNKKILFLCTPYFLNRERQGLVEALRKQDVGVSCLGHFHNTMEEVWERVEGNRPDLILHPEVYRTYLPRGIEEVDCPTACIHIDSYGEIKNRARMALLFDVALICHPGHPEYFEEQGHPESHLFSHAVRAPYYQDPLPEKTFDVAMVGRLEGANYTYRRSCLRALDALDLKTNDFDVYYEYPEMADLYRRSRIGLNVSRDDYIQDANLRCFEVMAGGALLMTPEPTELSQLGLEPGGHFVTFRSEEDLAEKVQYYLSHDAERREIACRGRDETLDRFTYDRWAERIVERVEDGISRQAPARSMSEGEAASIYVDYLSKRGQIDDTLYHLRRQRKDGGGSLIQSVGKAAKVTVRGWQKALFS